MTRKANKAPSKNVPATATIELTAIVTSYSAIYLGDFAAAIPKIDDEADLSRVMSMYEGRLWWVGGRDINAIFVCP